MKQALAEGKFKFNIISWVFWWTARWSSVAKLCGHDDTLQGNGLSLSINGKKAGNRKTLKTKKT